MPIKIQVAPLHEFTDLGNSRMLIRHHGRSIAVFYHDGDFYAVDNSCYHHGGPLLYGDIEDLAGHPCVICPWHEYKIALDSGECLYFSIDPTVQANTQHRNSNSQIIRSKGRKQRVHMVVVDKGIVYVELNESQEELESDNYVKLEVANRLEVMEHPVSDDSIVHPAPINGLKLHSNCKEWMQKAETCNKRSQNKCTGSSNINGVVQNMAGDDYELQRKATEKKNVNISKKENNADKVIENNTQREECKSENYVEESSDLSFSFPPLCRPVSNNPLLPPSELRRSWPCEKYATEQWSTLNSYNSGSNNSFDVCIGNDAADIFGYDNIDNNNSVNTNNSKTFSKLRKSTSDIQFTHNNYNNCVRRNEHLYVSCFRMEELGLNIKALYFKLVKGSIDHLPQLGEVVELELPNFQSKTIHLPIRRSFFIIDISSYGCFFAICIQNTKVKSATPNKNALLYEDGLHKIVKVKQFSSVFTMDTYVPRIRQVNGQVLWLTGKMGITSAYAGMKSYFDDAIFVNNKHESLHALHLHVDTYAQDIPYLSEFVRWRSQFNIMYTEKYNKSFSFVLFLTEQQTPIGGDNVKWQQAILYKRQLNASDVRRAIEVKYGNCVFSTESQPATSSLIIFVCGEHTFVEMAIDILQTIKINLDNVHTYFIEQQESTATIKESQA